jgi:hypothetical protein
MNDTPGSPPWKYRESTDAPIPLDKTTKHVFYVAHCSACDSTEDDDGDELRNSPEEAIDYVVDWRDWSREEPGRLLCPECAPIDL